MGRDRPECMTLAEARAKTRALLQGVDVIIEESYRAGPDFKPKVLTGADINSFYGFGSDSTVPTPPAVTNEKVFTLDGSWVPPGPRTGSRAPWCCPRRCFRTSRGRRTTCARRRADVVPERVQG